MPKKVQKSLSPIRHTSPDEAPSELRPSDLVRPLHPVRRALPGYLFALAGVALTTVVIQIIPGADRIVNISLLYLLIVIASAYHSGSGPSVVAALLAVLSFDWFLVEPRHTFTVNDPAEWLALSTFLLTAIVISQLTQTLRLRAEEARQRERETSALSRASWAVASQVSHQRTLTEVLQQMTTVIPGEAAAIVVHSSGGLPEVVASYPAHQDSLLDSLTNEELNIVSAALESGCAATRNGDELSLSNNTAYVPLLMEQRVLGVLFLRKRHDQAFSVEERRMMESLANHAAVALERHRLTQAEAQAEALAEADKLKTALLSMVSHDFRSPLAAIKASITGLLQDNPPWDPATQRELLAGINQETDRLNRMVGDILALSRLEADAWRPQYEMVSIAEVVSAALDSFNEEENRRITVNIDPAVRYASFDSVQIVQVLYNLLENALKYSPSASGVELRVTQPDQTLAIEVLDRGFGLPAGEEEKIFQRFYRAVRWHESSLPGSGIGLAICRGLVEAHGGHLQAVNRDGGGSVFRITLPLDENTHQPDKAA
ncbi:MAG TPA: DUF4118 domain-containing protein [Abditibacteriaceae bacterium]|jgi:two-component system sensor histidine kinase KdpD